MPLGHEFGTAERASIAAVAAAGLFLLGAGHTVFDPPSPGMGAPDARSLDARIARALHRPGGGRFLARVPDLGGIYVLPTLPLLAYGFDAVAIWRIGRPVLARADMNADLRLLAYAEATGWTLLLTGAVKYLVGRPRPYTEGALARPELRSRASEDNLSFFSGHASLTFAVGTFVTTDVSRALLRGSLAHASPARRFLLGHLAPGLVGYGLPALVSLSRIIDQQHWPSDVLIGALTGTLVARLVYGVHFDADGHPRGRHAPRLTPTLMAGAPGPGGAAVTFFGVGGAF